MEINKIRINGGPEQFHKNQERQDTGITDDTTWTWLRKGNLKRETESLSIMTQNNTIGIRYIKTKIDTEEYEM